MYTAYIILNYISVFVMVACVVTVSTHESSKMQKLAVLVCVMLTFSCIGFLIKSESKSAEGLIIGQKLVYATVTHGMFLMLLFILEYCRFSIPKFVRFICHGVNLFITVIVLTMDYHKLFYVRYWAEDIGGHMELMKEYGPAHTLAVAVFGLYMAAALAAAIEFSVKNIRDRSRYVWKLLIAVSLPCIAYIIPKLTDTVNELQPIAFSAFTVMLILMVYKSNIYDVNNIATSYSVKSLNNALVVFDSGYSFKGCNEAAIAMFPFLQDVGIDKDIRRQSELLTACLDGSRDEYTSDGKIFSVSVRPVKSGESVIGRVLWFDDVTMERKYTQLLTEQKQALETRVETLYDISTKDDMTGLFNRRHYESVISDLRGKEHEVNIVVAEIDINGLKDVNDNIGHTAGDELIIGAAGILTDVFSKYGSVFRTGGDEFFVIMTDPDVDIEEIKSKLISAASEWKGTRAESLSLSYGFVSTADNPDKTIDEIMIAADREMYRCKAEYYTDSGKDRRRKT